MSDHVLYTEFLQQQSACSFCSLPQHHFRETEDWYLTYSNAPYHPHHLLIIPKRHITLLSDMTKKDRGEVDDLVSKTLSVLKKRGYTDLTLLVREGAGSGRSVEHIHYNIIPATVIGDMGHEATKRYILTEQEVAKTIADLEPLFS